VNNQNRPYQPDGNRQPYQPDNRASNPPRSSYPAQGMPNNPPSMPSYSMASAAPVSQSSNFSNDSSLNDRGSVSSRGGRNQPAKSGFGPRTNNSGSAGNRDRGSRRDNFGGRRRNDDKDRRPEPEDRKEDHSARVKSPPRKRKASPANSSSHYTRTSSERETPRAPMMFSYVTPERDVIQLKQCYTKLHIPKDFSFVKCSWTKLPLGEIPVDHDISVDCGTKTDEESKLGDLLKPPSVAGESVASDQVTYNAKVMLFTGFKPKADANHLSIQLKFLVGRKDRSELLCIGGAWSKEIDGGDPATDRSVLIKTATRTFKEFTSIDLNEHAKQWYEFMEVHYNRTTGKEITVVYLPALWDVNQTTDVDESLDGVSVDDTEQPTETKEPTLRLSATSNVPASVKLKIMTLSLDGLLDYDISDNYERTFEVSLFAELFNDMLRRDFGNQILSAIEWHSKQRAITLEPAAKKQKTDEDETNEGVEEKFPIGKDQLLRAFEYFDKNEHHHSFFRVSELEDILYCIGNQLSKREVEGLVDKLIDAESEIEKIFYKKFLENFS